MPSLHTSRDPQKSSAPEAGPDGGATPAAGQPLLRVEKGHAEPDELAAVLVALLAAARPAGPRPIETVDLPTTARWNLTRGFAVPHSWQTVA